MTTPFLQAAIVAFREGLEAVLMLATLTAYLLRSDGRTKLHALSLGAAVGGGAALSFGLLFSSDSVAADPVLHSVVTLGSALLMTYLSGWIWVQRTEGLRTFLQRRATQAVESKAGVAIFLVAAFAIFREGTEVVLFLRMIAASSGDTFNALIAGPLTGLLCLIVTFIIVRTFSGKISLRMLFLVSSASLFILGLKFVGEGLALLQQAGLLPNTPIDHAAIMRDMGFNASWEAVIAQMMIVALALTGLFTVKDAKPSTSHDAR